jgi:gluconokinase
MKSSRENPPPPYILTLDIGSSSLRALLFDARGMRVPGVEAREGVHLRTTPPGASEADPDALLEALFRAIDAALVQAGDRARDIAGVAVDTFVSNILGVDEAGRAVVPLTTYADTRAAGEAEALRKEFDEAQVHNRTGCRFHPSYWPARLRWLHRVWPERTAKVARWLTLGEYLELKLFGETAVSYSAASWSGLLDRRQLMWDQALLAALPIEAGHLSPLTDGSRARRGLRPEFAARWPALARVPWFPAIGDGAGANIGSGCASPQRVALTVGTSSAMRAVTTDDIATLPPGLWCYRVDGRRSLPGGALTEGGMVYAWMLETLRLEENRLKPVSGEARLSGLEAKLAQIPPDSHGLTVLPFLAGERSPGWRGDARATIHGLTLATTPLDILRAGMEAVAYRIALVYEQLRSLLPADPEIIASGGALVNSPTWGQIMADALGRPMTLSRAEEASARGAALLALEALGVLPDIAAAPDLLGETWQPDLQRHTIYRAAMQRQMALYDRLMEDE